jgi:adenine-specific DNA-methyltransferase
MPTQLLFGFGGSLPDDAYKVGQRSCGETHGVVLTKPHVVRLILALAGYSREENLAALKLLEPSCGAGVFLVEAARRLAASAVLHDVPWSELHGCIRAFDIDERSVRASRANVLTALKEAGVPGQEAAGLVASWINQADFLLAPIDRVFDVVVGNPPYIRIEQLSVQLQTYYRTHYRTLFDRADLYVAFIERGLSLLSERGVLSYICADRWTMNRYGSSLRRLIADSYGVRCYIDLHQASPFETEVIAYPSIFVLQRGPVREPFFARLESGSSAECAAALSAYRSSKPTPRAKRINAARFPAWFTGDEPWVLSTPEHLAVLRGLEASYRPLESDNSTKVGIGVASGSDATFIVNRDTDIELDRLVPLVMRSHIENGRISWDGRFVINTFQDDGGAINLREYPKLGRYFREREATIRKRHVSKRSEAFWFRTIDRVYPKLVKRPKLLIPDIAGSNEVAFDPGEYHPHHNLYFVVSESWDLEVLGGLLSSKVALFFVWSYAVKMRGGYLRFQAQYLRRIRVPRPQTIPVNLQGAIRDAFRERDFPKLDALALKAYALRQLPEFPFVDTRR